MFDTTPATYKTQNVMVIDGFDPDQYGNIWHNVKFEGSGDTYMWLAKNEPIEGKEYYGHFEPTKSGKRFRFKTDKPPENASITSGVADNKYLKDVTDMPDRWMGRLLPYFDQQRLVKDGKITEHGRLYIETALALAEESMRYVDIFRGSAPPKESVNRKFDEVPDEYEG